MYPKALSVIILALFFATVVRPSPVPNASKVERVHVVFSHHLDVGLNEALRFVGFCRGFATKIVQEYFDDFIPRAIRIAKEVNSDLHEGGSDGDVSHRTRVIRTPFIQLNAPRRDRAVSHTPFTRG